MSMRHGMIGMVLAGAVALLLAGVLAGTGTTRAQSDCGIAGVINVDRTLSPTECDPYIVTGNLIVDQGITLTIEPGTTLSFDGQWSITVRGTLIAQGTASNKIMFTSGQDTPAPGDWGQIVFEGTSSPATFDAQGTYTGGNVLQHVIVEYGGGGDDIRSRGSAVIWGNETTFYLDQSTIGYSASGGVTQRFAGIDSLSMQITSCEFHHNAGTALTIDATDTVVITSNNIYTNGGGVRLGRGRSFDDELTTLIFADNLVQNNLDVAVSGVVEDFLAPGTMHIINNRVISNTGGLLLYMDDDVTGLVLDNIVRDNRSTGMHLDLSFADELQVTVSGNQISGNTSGLDFAPGGMNLDVGFITSSSFITVTNNELFNNTAPQGGGMWFDSRSLDGSLLFKENVFQGNHATEPNGGGAVHIRGYSVDEGSYSFTANEFIENTATDPDDDPDTPPTLRVPQDIRNNADSNNAPFNARGNIWGTDDRAEIQARIYDGSDDTGLAFVDFEDFRLESPRKQQSYNEGEGGSQESTDGIVQMTIPGAAITESTTVTQRILTAPTLPLPAGTTPRYSFSTSAWLQNGDILTRFVVPVTIVIDVPPGMAQADETALNLAYRDGSEWVTLLPCEGCSATDSQVTVVTDRIGEFALVNTSDNGGGGGGGERGEHRVYLPTVRR